MNTERKVMKPVFKLENWAVIYVDRNPYEAPETRTACLIGDRVREGYKHHVKTSRVLGKFGDYVETKNSLYELGDVDPEYEALYPCAKERLFGSLTEINEHN